MVKILIIDDEPLDLFISKKLLNMEYEAEGFTSIPEALVWAQQNNFDVALIDYYLAPDLYAQHALNQLVAIKGHTFQGIVLSNYVDKTQSDELLKAGFTNIIYKPLTLEALQDILKKA